MNQQYENLEVVEIQQEQQQQEQPTQSSQLKEKIIFYLSTSGVLILFGIIYSFYLLSPSDWNNCKNESLLEWSRYTRIYCFLFGILIIGCDLSPKQLKCMECFKVIIYPLAIIFYIILVFKLFSKNDDACGSLSTINSWFYYIGFVILIIILIVSCIFLVPGFVMCLAALYGGQQRNRRGGESQQQENV